MVPQPFQAVLYAVSLLIFMLKINLWHSSLNFIAPSNRKNTMQNVQNDTDHSKREKSLRLFNISLSLPRPFG